MMDGTTVPLRAKCQALEIYRVLRAQVRGNTVRSLHDCSDTSHKRNTLNQSLDIPLDSAVMI